jgi:hypothetical protein
VIAEKVRFPNKTVPVRRWSLAAGTTRGRLARFGYQPITSGSPPLVNFAQIRLTKRVTIFGIHDQKRYYQIQGGSYDTCRASFSIDRCIVLSLVRCDLCVLVC